MSLPFATGLRGAYDSAISRQCSQVTNTDGPMKSRAKARRVAALRLAALPGTHGRFMKAFQFTQL
ncbi:hypothetical protein I2750_07650 [Bacillus sp. PR5]|nr:hypothetical protein AYJ56_02100 [Brucella anthropi]MBJ6720127.1 hypothetical protein [Bacillus sp. PR5]